MAENIKNNTIEILEKRSDFLMPDFYLPYAICEGLIGIIAIIGNSLTIIAFFKKQKCKTRTNYFIIALAFADFFVGLVEVPACMMIAIGYPREKYSCLITLCSLVSSRLISIFFIISITIHRYKAIYNATHYIQRSEDCPKYVILFCCTLAAIIGYLPFIGWRYQDWDESSCFFMAVMHVDYVFVVVMIGFLLPIFTLIVVNGLLCLKVHQLSKVSATLRQNDVNGQASVRERQIRVTKNICVIVAGFTIFWLPLGTINTLNAFCDDCYRNVNVINFALVLSHANSAVNPVIYAYRIKEMRNALKDLLGFTDISTNSGSQ